VFENRVLRGTFGHNTIEMIYGLRALRSDERSLPIIIRTIKSRMIKWAGNVASMEHGNSCRVLMAKQEGNKQVRITRHRWEDNIKMGWYGSD
jgi:hypothetical protein